jgi:flagellar assembly factor FliW
MTTVMTETYVPAIELIDALPGFPELRQFGLVRLDESAMLFSLQSLEDPDVRFLVVPPAPFFPDYAPEVDDDTAERLGLTDAEDAVLLLIVTVGERPEDATANLLAPLVVNHTTLAAKQVVLADPGLPLRTPLHR